MGNEASIYLSPPPTKASWFDRLSRELPLWIDIVEVDKSDVVAWLQSCPNDSMGPR